MKITIRQIGGDDGYQWAVLIDGRVKWDGMSRNEARWRRQQEVEALEKSRRDSLEKSARQSK